MNHDRRYVCPDDICKYATPDQTNLIRHIKRKHPQLELIYKPADLFPYSCEECGRRYRSAASLPSHRRSKHPELLKAKAPEKELPPVICPGCDGRFYSHEKMVSHYAEKHEEAAELFDMSLENDKAFIRWLKELEFELSCSFSIRDSNPKCRRYRCTRVGLRKPSNRDLADCTAFVQVRFDDIGRALVLFCRHHSHECPPEALRLYSSLMEDEVIKMVQMGKTTREILQHFKNGFPSGVPARPTVSYNLTAKEKRRREGRLEYLIQWKVGDTNPSNATWEPEENVSCPEAIANYERQLLKVKTMIKGEEELANEAAEVEKILGLAENSGERYYLVKFTNKACRLVPMAEANTKWPAQVIQYYDQNLTLEEK
ncbi:unnamed protein product, partial [Mesorhabditis spiculigera]